jgi:hypothetical protein
VRDTYSTREAELGEQFVTAYYSAMTR